jgi:hypothetical protein
MVWNRSSALSPAQVGTINSAVAVVMKRAAVIASGHSLSAEELVEFYARVRQEMDVKIAAYIKEIQSAA